jgi:hypothetical protein
MCIAYENCAMERGVLDICLPRKPRCPNLLEEAYERLHSVPCLLTLRVLGVDGPWAYRQHDSWVKMHNLCRVLKLL